MSDAMWQYKQFIENALWVPDSQKTKTHVYCAEL